MFETEADFRAFLTKKVMACAQFSPEEQASLAAELEHPLSAQDLPDLDNLIQLLIDAEMVEVMQSDDTVLIEAFNDRMQAMIEYYDQLVTQIQNN